MTVFMKRIGLGIIGTLLLAVFAMQSAAIMEWIGWRGFGKPETLRLGAYEGDVGALEWIAKDRGFFEKVGLKVEVVGFASGREAAEALRAGTVDVATGSDFVAVTRSFKEDDLQVLGSICNYRNTAIVARRSDKLTAPGDLKGKRIGVTAPSSAEYALYVFLAMNGMSSKDATIESLPPKRIVEAIGEGAIDAASIWAPHIQSIQERLGTEAAVFDIDGFDAYLLLLTRKEVADQKERAVRKLLRALVLAEDWVRDHPDDAKAYLANRFKLAPAYVDWLWPRMQLGMNLPQELLAALDGQARWLAKKDGIAGQIPNYARHVRPDDLRSVRASAVTLFADVRRPVAGTAGTR